MSEPEEPIDKTVRDEHIVKGDSEIIRHEEEFEPVHWRIHPGLIAALVLAIVVVFFFGWYMLRSGANGGGQPVPAPRSSINDSPAETLTNKTLTLSPDQVKNAGISFETVGEQLSTQSAETSATGTVEANAYKQTPAVSLVGGVVRRVVPELGENVSAGQTVAVISSDEFADTQSKYISLKTEADNARRNYERTQKLVTINQPGHSELEQFAASAISQ